MTLSAMPKIFCYSDFFYYAIMNSTRTEFIWNLQNFLKMGEEIS